MGPPRFELEFLRPERKRMDQATPRAREWKGGKPWADMKLLVAVGAENGLFGPKRVFRVETKSFWAPARKAILFAQMKAHALGAAGNQDGCGVEGSGFRAHAWYMFLILLKGYALIAFARAARPKPCGHALQSRHPCAGSRCNDRRACGIRQCKVRLEGRRYGSC